MLEKAGRGLRSGAQKDSRDETWEQGRDVPVFARLPEPAPAAASPAAVSEVPRKGAAAASKLPRHSTATGAAEDAPFAGFDPFADAASPRKSAPNAGNRPK